MFWFKLGQEFVARAPGKISLRDLLH